MDKQVASEKVTEMVIGKRTSLGLSKRQFAKRLGVSTTSVSKWESGTLNPDSPTLLMILGMHGQTEEVQQ